VEIFGVRYLKKQFDFRLAGKWLVYGSIIGVVAGLGAILFYALLSLVSQLVFTHWMGLSPTAPGGESEFFHFVRGPYIPWLVVLIPTAGGLISGWIVYTFAPEAEGHGTDEVIKSFHRKRGIIKARVPFVKLIASVITIGSGGSGGREGPIAQIGAGFGSFLGARLGLNTRTRRWLMAAGMGAGIGSIFQAPLAGAIFSAEVLYSDPEMEAEVLLPSTVASIIAYTIFSSVFGWSHMFISTEGLGFSNALELIPYLILAVILALLAHLYVSVFYGVRTLFTRLKINNIYKPAIGGFLTGLLGLTAITILDDRRFVVDLMGGGYGILQEIFENGLANLGIGLLLIVGFGKILTTSFTISSGGSAGVFGPSMVIGGSLGAAVGFSLDKLVPGIISNPTSFTIVGMAGFFAAAASTPLSTIIMVSELTGNYELLLPTMWVATIAYFIARKWTIYKSQVPNPTYSQAHFGRYAPDIIEETSVNDCYKKARKFHIIKQTDSIQDILGVVDQSRQRIFPVVDNEQKLVGGFNIDDITHVLQDHETKIKTAGDLMYTQIPQVDPEDKIDKAYKLMNDHYMDEALVVSDYPEHKILGIITSSDIVLTYNRRLSDIRFGEEDEETSPYDKKLLQTFSLKTVLETDLLTVKPDDKLSHLVEVITRSARNIFPVVDEKMVFHGVVLLNDVRSVMFDTAKYDTLTIADLMTQPPDKVYLGDPMKTVVEKFEHTRAWNLPVVNKRGKYQGLVSKSSIFSVYRDALIQQTGN
jgi:CIC family chloride channel protein